MQAHEVNDPKIDPKYNLTADDTIQSWIEKGKIRNPSTLSIRETRAIFKRILKIEALVVGASPLPQTIYTFAYFII